MPQRLQGKVALVTAAGQGIGRAIAEAFSSEGARLIATDLDEGKLADINSAQAAASSTCVRLPRSKHWPRTSQPSTGRSTCWSIAPVTFTTEQCSIAASRTGISPST